MAPLEADTNSRQTAFKSTRIALIFLVVDLRLCIVRIVLGLSLGSRRFRFDERRLITILAATHPADCRESSSHDECGIQGVVLIRWFRSLNPLTLGQRRGGLPMVFTKKSRLSRKNGNATAHAGTCALLLHYVDCHAIGIRISRVLEAARRLRRRPTWTLVSNSASANEGERRSGSSPFVMVMQTAHFRHLDYFAFASQLYPSCFWRVFVQRQMSSPIVVIATITRQDATQRALIEHKHMIETFAANRANDSFHIRPLPGRARCR